MRQSSLLLSLLLVATALLMTGCGARSAEAAAGAGEHAETTYVLRTDHADGRMVFVGHEGAIAGVVNPDLMALAGETVQIMLINGDGISHDIAVPELGAKSAATMGKDKTSTITFMVPGDAVGDYLYYCTVSGHRQAGMEGRIVVQRAG